MLPWQRWVPFALTATVLIIAYILLVITIDYYSLLAYTECLFLVLELLKLQSTKVDRLIHVKAEFIT